MFNAYWEALDFDLPAVPETAASGWQRWIDTARESPEDIVDPPTAPLVPGTQYRVMPRSVVVLLVAHRRPVRSAVRDRGKRQQTLRRT